MNKLLFAIAAFHVILAVCEIFPWSYPVLLRVASKKLPTGSDGRQWNEPQQRLVATIVQNAGIYNAILAGGLLWAAFAGDSSRDFARVLLVGVTFAGVFGSATLRNPVPAIQALLGIIGFLLV